MLKWKPDFQAFQSPIIKSTADPLNLCYQQSTLNINTMIFRPMHVRLMQVRQLRTRN